MIINVIFDIDGTLIDSNHLHAESWQRAFAKFGKIIEFKSVLKQIGKGSDQLLPEFLTDDEIKEFGAELEKYRSELFKREYLSQVKPFPKVRELFEKIVQNDGRIVLASSGAEEDVEKFKKILNISDLLEDSTSSEDVESSKPEPDIFLTALKKLGNPPKSECVVVGDTPYDAIAAEIAGLKIIGVTCGGWSAEILKEFGCGEIFENPSDLLENFNNSLIGDISDEKAATGCKGLG